MGEQEDFMVFFQQLDRHLTIGLPELEGNARERLLKQQFIRSLPGPLHDQVKLASMVEDSKALDLVTVAQNLSERVTVRSIQHAELEQKVNRLSEMVEQLLAIESSSTTSQRNVRVIRNGRRCFRCNQSGHVARFCTNVNVPHCFPLSMPSQWRVPVLQNTLVEIQKQVTEMESKGIIRRTHSPYSSPVLLTKKADGIYRFCIDFRELNSVTVKDAFPVPQMEEIFSSLHSAKQISLIDFRSGYGQLPIAEEDRHKTAFSVNGQQYEFLRMPFGLCNAPATFRRLLLMVLGNLQGVVVYGDDIIVFSETEQEHVTRLGAVLQRLDEAGLKLSRKKSQIAQKSIFAEKASPLLKLLRKDVPFVWTAEADQAFDHLKACIAEALTCLRLPNPGEMFTVAVDASNVAIGAVLSQPTGVVEYASRVLTGAEQKYSTTEKECLAIVWALEKWRNYLLASEFRVVTDHKPLSWLMTAKDPRGRLARWAYRLQEFNFTIEHVDGVQNVLPDMLSRSCLDDNMPDDAIPAGTKPEATSEEVEELLKIWDRLKVENDMVVVAIDGRKVPFVPPNKRERVMRITHDGAHKGFERVFELLRRRVFWPTMRKDVAAYLRECPNCQTSRKMESPSPPMRSMETPVTLLANVQMTERRLYSILLQSDGRVSVIPNSASADQPNPLGLLPGYREVSGLGPVGPKQCPSHLDILLNLFALC
ncbi:unnamed protein product [Dicrocoelium dendriticum]|nr:unnamed protein product [Dicrocoelium dendriticum]